MSEKKKILFIINPISGIGKQKVIPGMIDRILDKKLYDAEVSYTERAGHAKDIAKQAVQEGFDVVCAVGGDGSVNEVASGLANSNTAMAMIPTGSGNGLARHLGIPMKPELAMKYLNTAKTESIDTGLLNDHFFVGTAGIGFDAHIAHRFDQSGKRGPWNYIRIVLREFFKYQPQTYTIHCDGKTMERKAMLITFANSSQWGNNALIAPNTDVRDGKLSVCILHPFKVWHAPALAIRLFRGTLLRSRKYTQVKCEKLRIEHVNGAAHLDGEPILVEGELTAQIQHSSLIVLA